MKKTLLFDMDGTLLDSSQMWEDFFGEIINDKDLIDSLEPIDYKMGTTVEYSINYITDILKHDFNKNKLANYIDMYLSNYYENHVLAKDNVFEKIKQLKEDGYDIHVATATDQKYARLGLEKNNLMDYIGNIFTPDTLNYQKHEAGYFNSILDKLGIKASEALFFDDVLYAVKLAKSLDIKTIGVFDIFAEDRDIIKEISDHYIMNFSEITENILRG